MSLMCADEGRRRHGIEPARVPRVAARKAREREPAAPQDAEAQHRLQGVLRAGGIEAARRPQERTDGPLIQADQEGCDVAHCSPTFFHSAARLSRSASPVASRARGRILTTRSTAGISRWCRRKDSRMMRRMRLRATAPPAARTATASPRRGAPDWLTLAVTAKKSVAHAPPARVGGIEVALASQTKSRRQSEPPWHRALEETLRMDYAGAVAVRATRRS